MGKYKEESEMHYAVIVGVVFYCSPTPNLEMATSQYETALKDSDNKGRVVKLITCKTIKSRVIR